MQRIDFFFLLGKPYVYIPPVQPSFRRALQLSILVFRLIHKVICVLLCVLCLVDQYIELLVASSSHSKGNGTVAPQELKLRKKQKLLNLPSNFLLKVLKNLELIKQLLQFLYFSNNSHKHQKVKDIVFG